MRYINLLFTYLLTYYINSIAEHERQFSDAVQATTHFQLSASGIRLVLGKAGSRGM